jgi:hypothetical protein
MMIGLEFVKKIDKNWKKNIDKVYVYNFNEKQCPNCRNSINLKT